ncbi:MAG: DsbA family protein, partial [Nocardioidaceae bacterium]
MATKRQRRERLAHAEQQRREQERQAKRRRAIRTTGIAVAAVLVIVAGAFAFVQLTEDEPVVTPNGVTAAGGVAYPAHGTGSGGNKSAGSPVEVVVYEDPLCEHCRDFEEEHGTYLQDAADRGDISLEYRPIALLGDDSVAPINAAACVLDAAGQQAFVSFHDALFAGEYADDDLETLATDAGAGGPGVADCIDSGTHDGWV